ncbi:diaminopimelate epimerase [Neomegalonema sp.]|uniref:diaminopimelate epimerase n=1 Tax=Neomegalonema sp. TaxID=2039713 RepID=UPI002634E5CE|nr:diaminopimelate epimerase [Neomegalonema sp.]MDD2868223.1 diaminopimelate epimerase [Neomegalonema sp.]
MTQDFERNPYAFRKMHGLGNDFVILDRRMGGFPVTPERARRIADRRRGVGFDQLVVLEGSGRAAARMVILNPDGSESGACGNATRCVARLLMEEAGVRALTVETAAGLLACEALADGRYRVDMGPPRLEWREIPMSRPMATDRLDYAPPGFAGEILGAGAANMGNPHVAFFVRDVEAVPLAAVGPRVEHDPLFPERINVEFCQVLAPDRIRMRVWERGAGITEACGSGACATVVAGARLGLTGRRAEVILDGGSLEIDWTDSGVLMTGPAALSYAGVLDAALAGAE